jgi:hypothetical protein
MLQLRTSLGAELQFHWGQFMSAERGVFPFLQLREDALFYVTSRYGLGIGVSGGLGSTSYSGFTPEIGVRLIPAVVRLGSQRSLELGFVVLGSYLANLNGPQAEPLGGPSPDSRSSYAVAAGFALSWLAL